MRDSWKQFVREIREYLENTTNLTQKELDEFELYLLEALDRWEGDI